MRVFRGGVFRCFQCSVSVRQTTTKVCFWRCVSLAAVSVRQTTTKVCFRRCVSLAAVSVRQTTTKVCFRRCVSLAAVSVRQTTTKVCFRRCVSLAAVSVRQTTTKVCFRRCVSLALWPQDLEGRGLHGSYRRKETSLTLVLCSTATQGGYYCQLDQEFDCKPKIANYFN